MAKLHTFGDNFNDNSFDESKFTKGEFLGGTITESNQRLNFNGESGGTIAEITSINKYDFTDSMLMAEVGGSIAAIGGTLQFFPLYVFNTSFTANFEIIDTTSALPRLMMHFDTPSISKVTVDSATFHPSTHGKLRVRESGSVIYYERYDNAEVWVTIGSIDISSYGITDFDVQVYASFVNNGTTARPVYLDNLNYEDYTLEIESIYSGGGTATPESETAHIDIVSSYAGGGSAVYSTTYQALPQKDYEYRVFDKDGNFKSIWAKEVTSDFGYDQTVNQNASELTVTLARSPDNRKIVLETLLDESDDPILDENSDPLLVQTETANSVGVGTDVDLNLNVDVYAFYGGYDELLDHNSDPILDHNSETILVPFGFPNGRRVYSGYIADYELVYGEETGVNVLVVPHATEMSHYLFYDGTDTTVKYLNTDPVQMARDAIDNYTTQGGLITYTEASMPLSGQSVDYDFKLQTTREVQDKAKDLLPSGYYHFVHPGENKQYMLSKGETADHTFYYEKHIKELRLRKSITQLVNKIAFIGGVSDAAPDGTPPLYKYYEDATSIANIRPGLERLADSRVHQATSATILSERKIAEFKDPRYRTSVEITDADYDIEDINLGEMVGFKNFGTFVDELLLQIVSVQRKKHSIIIDLDMSLPGEAKRLEELKRSILSEEIRDIADAPA